jgi:multisubunit Na+/H+ antiporter MnhB subunit
MKYLVFAICLGGVVLFALSFNPAWRLRTVGIAVIGGVLFLAVTGAIPLGMGLRYLGQYPPGGWTPSSAAP